MKYVFKISGEVLSDSKVISEEKVKNVCLDIQKIINQNNKLVVVCGAGNIWRGRSTEMIDMIDSDYIGMQATNLNISVIYSMLNLMGIKAYRCSAIPVDGVIEKYDINKAKEYFNNGYVVLIGGGTGMPGLTTDTAVVRRALEFNADTILFGKNIDGVYDKDPSIYSDAKKYDVISPTEILTNQFKIGIDKQGVMDPEALVSLCNKKTSIYVYKADDMTAIDKILKGDNPGTIIKS